MFFDLHSRGLLRDRDVVLIDSNADLIGCYETVRTRQRMSRASWSDCARAASEGARTITG